MYSSRDNIEKSLGSFQIRDSMLQYSDFVPWAAHVHHEKDSHRITDPGELSELILVVDDAMRVIIELEEVELRL